jgi:hypothetical protein
VGKESINAFMAVGDSVGEGNMKVGEEVAEGEEKVVVVDSDDVTCWSQSLQDYSELYFLCHSTNSHSANSTSVSSSSANSNSHSDVGNSSALTTSASNTPLLLDMKEPNPDTSEGMDKWLAWFDGLKLYEDKLSTLIS